MKKFSILGVFLLCASMFLSAAPRTVDAARVLAATHFSSRSSSVSGKQHAPAAELRLAYTHPMSAAEANSPALYVFNNGDNGFVIVSADDCAKEVLAYSDHGTFDANKLPANVQFYLNVYAAEIARGKAHGVVRKASKKAASYPAVSPLCTAQWNQDTPYNNLCPMDGSSRSVTGCVATAAAQLLYANKYPTTGTGSHSYTWNNQTLSANFGATTYQWSNMLDDYSGYSTTAQETAVATLMYHCGVACNMGYSADASGAYNEDMERGLVSYFGYDKGIYHLLKDYLKESDLLAMMANDLQAGHTIFMGGATKEQEGHAFICDGMDAKGYLHINWGWGGYCDGYYQISALEPAEQGIGGASSGLPFTEGVTVALNIKPNADGNEAVTLTATSITMTTANTIGKNDNASFRIVDLANNGLYTVSNKIAFSVYNEDGSIYSSSSTGVSVNLDPWYYYEKPINASINLSSLADGKYYLSVGVVQNNTFWPFLAYATGEQLFAFTVSGSTITFSDLVPEPTPEPIAPSLDFTQAEVYNWDASGSTNHYDIHFCTADYDNSGNAVKGTRLYLYAYAKSMTSLVGTFAVNGSSSIGDVFEAKFYYGDGDTEAEITLSSGYVTITLDEKGNYLLSYELTDTNGNTYTEAGRIIAAANVTGHNTQTSSPYTLTNEKVSAVLSASEALTMTANLSHTNLTTMSYFVEGLTSYCRNTADQVAGYGTNRFDISDDATTTNQFYSYNTKWLGNTSYTAEVSNYPQIGDRVVIFGPVQNYSSTTPEIKGYIYECSLTASCALSNLQATSTDGYNYTFSWENSPYPASAYTLFVYDASGSQVYSRNTTSRSQSIPFTKSGNYTWAVRAEDSNGHVLNEATGALFTVTLAGVAYSFTITTTVADNCTMDFSNGMWYYWWNSTTSGSVQAQRNNEGKYVATIETQSESIGCLVATADPQTEGWDNLQQTEDSPTLYGDACLLVGNEGDNGKWNLESRPCNEDLSLYLPSNLQVTTGVGEANFSWNATEYEQFELLVNKVETPNSTGQYIVSNLAAGLIFNNNAVGKWQWRVRALSNNGAALSAFVEGAEFEIKENPYLPYNLKATTQDSATYYLSWDADVQASQYLVSVGNGFSEYVTTQPVEVTFTQEGFYTWVVYPCDANGNQLGFVRGEDIYVPAHAVPDYSIANLQVQTTGATTTATWNSAWDNFEVRLYDRSTWEYNRFTTSNTYYQWENLAAGEYEVDVYPVDANGNYVWDASQWLTFTVEETAAPTPQYHIVISADANGSVNSTINGYYNAGTVLNLVATPNDGYRFVQWSDGNLQADRNLVLMQNTFLTASFELIPQVVKYTVTVNGAEGGTTNLYGTHTYEANSTITLLATPDAGYEFTGWNLGKGNSSSDNPLFYTVTENVTITPVFTEKAPEPTYTLKVHKTGQGMVTISPEQETYQNGAMVALTAIPAEGWQFKQWEDGSVSATRYLTMTENKEVTATFEEMPEEPEPTTYYTLTKNIVGQGSVTASPKANQYAAGSTVILTATPAEGWQFKQWEDNTTNAIRSITMDANKVVKAIFEEAPEYAVQSLNVSVTKQTAKATWTSGAPFFEVKVTNKKGVEQASDTISAKTYTFKGSQGQTYTIAVRPMETDKQTYLENATTKSFTLERLYNVYISALSGGTVNDEEVNGDYEYGTEITIVATPKAGYRFKKWSDDNTQATRKITIEEDVYLEASFSRIPTYTVTVFEVTGGTTTLVGDTTLMEGENLSINAIPEEGYIFSQWLVNGEVNTDNPFVITAIDQDYYIEPVFVKEEMGVEQTTIDNAAQKYMVNGVLYIRRGENVYDAKGNRN